MGIIGNENADNVAKLTAKSPLTGTPNVNPRNVYQNSPNCYYRKDKHNYVRLTGIMNSSTSMQASMQFTHIFNKRSLP